MLFLKVCFLLEAVESLHNGGRKLLTFDCTPGARALDKAEAQVEATRSLYLHVPRCRLFHHCARHATTQLGLKLGPTLMQMLSTA